MAEYLFKLPDLGEGIAESEIAEWRVSEGDAVTEDQPLVDMLTEKAAIEIPSPVTGKIQHLHGGVGDRVPVGAVLVTFTTEGGAQGAKESTPPDPPNPQAAGKPAAAAAAETGIDAHARSSGNRIAAAPAVRRKARERGVDLHDVRGSGPHGRILQQDLDAHTAHQRQKPEADPEQSDTADVEKVPVIGVRRRIADHLQRTTQRVPHFSYVEEMDVTALETLRASLNEEYATSGRLTLLPLLIQALVRAVAKFPEVNSIYDDENGVVLKHRAIHVGIATHTPAGLLVPVLRDAQKLDLWSRGQRIRELAEVTRAGKASREQLSGSTITITSLGALGGIVTTPILNAPEVAIIGVNKVIERPMVVEGKIEVRKMMNLSSSFDHRIIDGYVAASFIQEMKRLLESPAMLFIAPPRAPPENIAPRQAR
jgi:2-oxoisovalerate dehydrogenase E2 component (dihydrolipoyl transacylase)